MKAFTNIKQSKKLAEILPVESADMSWAGTGLGKPFARIIPSKGYPEEICPCWSLAALLDILSETIEDEWAVYELIIDMIYKKPEYVRLGDCNHSDFPSWDWDNEELLDNIVESVIWLNNNGYLRNVK